MKAYELTYIISSEITSEEAEAKAKEIEKAISTKEGVVSKQVNPLAKALSYPIKKHASGFVGSIEFQAEPEKLVEIKEIIQKDGKIVRHMVIVKEATEFKKERRTRTLLKPKSSVPFEIEKKEESEIKNDKPASAKSSGEAREKVELKDIEQTLDELLE